MPGWRSEKASLLVRRRIDLFPRRLNLLLRQFVARIDLQRMQEFRQRARVVALVAQLFPMLYMAQPPRKTCPLIRAVL